MAANMVTARIHESLEEAERTRRARLLGTLLIVLLAAVISLSVAALIVANLSATYDALPRIGLLTMGGLVCLVSYGLLRGGWLRGASWTFFLGCTVVVAVAVFLIGFRGPESILFLLLIVMAGMLAGGRGTTIVAGLAIAFYASAVAAEQWGLYTPPLQLDRSSLDLVSISVRLVSFGLMGLATWFFATNLQEALNQARQQAMIAQQQNIELTALKEELERRVAERTHDLTQALETVTALAAPVIPVAEGVIILPLVGYADEERMHRMISSLLAGIQAHRARFAIMDITGLGTVDTMTAAHLIEAAQSARLLGCELVLVGVRAEVAHALVKLDVDLSAVVTQANLQSGIEYAMSKRVAAEGA